VSEQLLTEGSLESRQILIAAARYLAAHFPTQRALLPDVRFMSFLAEFRATHPGCDVTLVEGVPGRLAELLLDGNLDLAVMAQPQAFSDRLEVRPLYNERFCVAFPMGHRFREKNRVHIADVAGETYLARINCEYQDRSKHDQIRIWQQPDTGIVEDTIGSSLILPL
jgi:DNA-binding transcriptional LysR family regulator